MLALVLFCARKKDVSRDSTVRTTWMSIFAGFILGIEQGAKGLGEQVALLYEPVSISTMQ